MGGAGSRRLLPGDEGLDFGQGLVVGLGDELTMAEVPIQEAQPAGGQFAGQFPLKGTDADAEVSAEGVYFTSHDADSSDGLFAGGAGNFRTADIYGHSRRGPELKGTSKSRLGPGSLLPGGLSSHQTSCCLSGFIGFVHVQCRAFSFSGLG